MTIMERRIRILFPFAAAAGGLAWQKLMHLLRRDASNAALVLETSERHESANPIDDALAEPLSASRV